MTDNALIPQARVADIIALDETLRAAHQQIADGQAAKNETLVALTMANSIQLVREMLTDEMMADVMKLMGSPLGFITDRDDRQEKYSTIQVRDVVIVALLNGYRLVGNEFNILFAQWYPTSAGVKRKVQEFPGLTDLKLTPGVPINMPSGAGALVPYQASWKLNGIKDGITCKLSKDQNEQVNDTRIPVRVKQQDGKVKDGGGSVDSILGKAKSKIYRRILEQLTGSKITTADEAGETEHEEQAPALEHDRHDQIDLIEMELTFETLDEILQCNHLRDQLQALNLRDSDRAAVDSLFAARVNHIRNERGERSND